MAGPGNLQPSQKLRRWKVVFETLPSSIKHVMQSHFMPQRLSTVPERYTYSSLSKMFMERNHHQEKTNSWVRRCCPLWGIYFCGNLDNGTCVWLKCRMPKSTKERWLWGKTRNKNQRWRESVTSIPACVTTPKNGISEIRGRWEGGSFLVNAFKPPRLRPENTRQAN